MDDVADKCVFVYSAHACLCLCICVFVIPARWGPLEYPDKSH